MNNARSLRMDVGYNNVSFSETVGADIESMTYTDVAADNSDSIDITLNAQDDKWINGWMPEMGATLAPDILGNDWEKDGDSRTIRCGSFVLDDVDYTDAPSTMRLGGVSKPSDSDFSELERETVWKNTSIKRIGETIAERYGLGFSYDAEDYDIACDEQDGTDSSYYNQLCKYYGLVLKVYASNLWVYDREAYKEKEAVKTFHRTDIEPGSFQYSTTLSGTFTGGHFSYSDPDTDTDIECSIGGGKHTKNVNRRATSVQDALIQLCAEINNANHGTTTIHFATDGEWAVSASDCIEISGYGKLDGKYFVDKVTHEVSNSGLTSRFACSRVEKGFKPGDAGGNEEPGQQGDETLDAKQGAEIKLTEAAGYVSSTAKDRAITLTGNYWLYDGILINDRYRVTNTAARCGKLPVGNNVTAWVDAEDCVIVSSGTGNDSGSNINPGPNNGNGGINNGNSGINNGGSSLTGLHGRPSAIINRVNLG